MQTNTPETTPRDFMQEPDRPFPTKKVIRWALLGIAVASVVLLVAYYAYQVFGPSEREIAARNLSGSMQEVSSRARSGDVEGAQELLVEQAMNAENPTERGVALLTHAQLSLGQDVATGVQEHKGIADDESLPSTVRASALVSLATYYYFNTFDANVLTAAIFSGSAPYTDMLSTGAYQSDREAAYAALLMYAEEIQTTAVANAYLARYWANELYQIARTGTSVAAVTDNAYTYRSRAQWFIDNASKESNTFDLSEAVLGVQLGITEAYLTAADVGEHALSPALAQMVTSFEEMTNAVAHIASQEGTVASDSETLMLGVQDIQHQFWVDALGAAVEIVNTDPEVAVAIADTYASYIASDVGVIERSYAVSTDSDVAPLINTLSSVSDMLNRELSERGDE